MPEFLICKERKVMIDELVKRLPGIRKRMHISQEDLGRMVGKSRQKISDIERGTAPMGWDTYVAACIALETFGSFSAEDDSWYYEAKKDWFKR